MINLPVAVSTLTTLFSAVAQLFAQQPGPDGRVNIPFTVAAQPTLWDATEVWVTGEGALSAATASNPENFLIHPERTIIAAEPHPDAANVVRLQLDPAQPLEADSVYTIRLVEGTDPEGNPLDTYWTHVDVTARTIVGELEHILGTQLPDGAIAINRSRRFGWARGVPVRIVPYFSCMAGVGLLKGHALTGREDLLAAVRDYVDWHVAHFEEDDTITDYRGSYPNYPSTGDYDSTDSYGALFAYLLWQYYMHTGDEAYLREHYGSVLRAISAMELTLQDDGLTWAKPAWPIKYTMDNVEVFQGYQAAAQIARVTGERDDYDRFIAGAERTRRAILDHLYIEDARRPRFSVGLDNGDNIFGGWDVYYPDGMANDFPLAYLLPPDDPRASAAWAQGRAKFLPGNVPDGDVEFFMAKAAVRHGDELGYLLANARASQLHDSTDWSFNSGQLLRLAHRLRGHAARVATAEDASEGSGGWQQAMRLSLQALGEALETDNNQASDPDAPNGYHAVAFLRDAEGLAMTVTSHGDPHLAPPGDGGSTVTWRAALVDRASGAREEVVLHPAAREAGGGFRVYTAWHRFGVEADTEDLEVEISVTESSETPDGSREVTLSLRDGQRRLLPDGAPAAPSLLSVRGNGETR